MTVVVQRAEYGQREMEEVRHEVQEARLDSA